MKSSISAAGCLFFLFLFPLVAFFFQILFFLLSFHCFLFDESSTILHSVKAVFHSCLVMSEAARHNSERYWYRLISVFCEWYNRLYQQGHVNEMAGKGSHWRQKPCYLSILCSLSLSVTSVVLVLKANPNLTTTAVHFLLILLLSSCPKGNSVLYILLKDPDIKLGHWEGGRGREGSVNSWVKGSKVYFDTQKSFLW